MQDGQALECTIFGVPQGSVSATKTSNRNFNILVQSKFHNIAPRLEFPIIPFSVRSEKRPQHMSNKPHNKTHMNRDHCCHCHPEHLISCKLRPKHVQESTQPRSYNTTVCLYSHSITIEERKPLKWIIPLTIKSKIISGLMIIKFL